jgi:hypothetical protein
VRQLTFNAQQQHTAAKSPALLAPTTKRHQCSHDCQLQQLRHSHMLAHVHSCTRSHQEGGARSERCSIVNGDVGDGSASSECVRVPRQSQHCMLPHGGCMESKAAPQQQTNMSTQQHAPREPLSTDACAFTTRAHACNTNTSMLSRLSAPATR